MLIYRFIGFILFFIISFTTLFSQGIVEIFEETKGFAQMFTWGDRNQNVGLRFTWKMDNDVWIPAGNGFEFISKGLGLYSFAADESYEVEVLPGQWYVKKELRNYDVNLDPALYNTQNMITWTTDHEEKKPAVSASIKLKRDSVEKLTPMIPYVINYEKNDGEVEMEKIEILTFQDSVTGDLIFRFTNLLPNELVLNIDNEPYPASYVGWRTLMTAIPGKEEIVPTVSAIKMDGFISIPPFSFAIYVFPTRPQKRQLPKSGL